ncbi:hypothetical protein V9T40_004650 [Parthenolecanium corni]|uniref:Uncharacterized protein n=1 Tax=Parthenolecanium corni TaxID=536013 RepID=A0AAN9TCN3_9HEMI
MTHTTTTYDTDTTTLKRFGFADRTHTVVPRLQPRPDATQRVLARNTFAIGFGFTPCLSLFCCLTVDVELEAEERLYGRGHSAKKANTPIKLNTATN